MKKQTIRVIFINYFLVFNSCGSSTSDFLTNNNVCKLSFEQSIKDATVLYGTPDLNTLVTSESSSAPKLADRIFLSSSKPLVGGIIIYLKKLSSSFLSSIDVEIYTNNSATIPSQVTKVANSTKYLNDISADGAWTFFEFNDIANLEANKNYWLYIKPNKLAINTIQVGLKSTTSSTLYDFDINTQQWNNVPTRSLPYFIVECK